MVALARPLRLLRRLLMKEDEEPERTWTVWILEEFRMCFRGTPARVSRARRCQGRSQLRNAGTRVCLQSVCSSSRVPAEEALATDCYRTSLTTRVGAGHTPGPTGGIQRGGEKETVLSRAVWETGGFGVEMQAEARKRLHGNRWNGNISTGWVAEWRWGAQDRSTVTLRSSHTPVGGGGGVHTPH